MSLGAARMSRLQGAEKFAEPPAAEMRRRSAYVRRAARLRGSGDGRVDEDLYGRQLCVMGHAALRSLARSTILLIGPTRRCRPLVTLFSFFKAGTRGMRGRLQFRFRSAAASIGERRVSII